MPSRIARRPSPLSTSKNTTAPSRVSMRTVSVDGIVTIAPKRPATRSTRAGSLPASLSIIRDTAIASVAVPCRMISGNPAACADRSVGVYRIKDSRALCVDMRHARGYIDLALRERLAFFDDRLRRRGCNLRRSVRPDDLDTAINRAIPACANRLACLIDSVEPRDHVRTRLSALDSSDGEPR